MYTLLQDGKPRITVATHQDPHGIHVLNATFEGNHAALTERYYTQEELDDAIITLAILWGCDEIR